MHLFGPAALVRAVLPHMRAQRAGAIVQLSSMGGQLSFAGFAAYSATKFALEGFSEALADEVGPLGIKVLIVEPGSFRTGLFGAGSSHSTETGDYAGTVGPSRRMIESSGGSQPGDPAKAAAAILTALGAERTPCAYRWVRTRWLPSSATSTASARTSRRGRRQPGTRQLSDPRHDRQVDAATAVANDG